VPSWNDLGPAFHTLRELDVAGIREDAERSLLIACVGDQALFVQVARLLRTGEGRRYGPEGLDPLHFTTFAVAAEEFRAADLLLVLLDARTALHREDVTALNRLADSGIPMVIVIGYAEMPPDLGAARPAFAYARIVALPDVEAPDAGRRLADALVERLPSERQLAAARRLPGIRAVITRELINNTSFSNASYALASAIPEQIPILSVPFAVADILVLTKNQALLVYKLALAHGAPPEFQARIREVLPVIGGAYLWRQIARTLVGLVPIWGIVPKVAIAYAGTYATGIAAWRWFADGELVSSARMRQIVQEAMVVGRERAQAMIAAAQASGELNHNRWNQLVTQWRERLPWRKTPPPPGDDPARNEPFGEMPDA
jgi:uncharacterized protein (DUF697 family)